VYGFSCDSAGTGWTAGHVGSIGQFGGDLVRILLNKHGRKCVR
jgi:hypothetical protein